MEEIILQLASNVAKYCCKKQVGKINVLSKGVDNVAADSMSREVLAKVKKHANVVTGAALANGIPGGSAVALTAIIASTWKMYYDINKTLGISFSENFLKSTASGIVSNLASNGAAVVGTNMLSWIPGIGTVGAMLGGMAVNRASLYAAAVSYLKILSAIADKGGNFSESTFKATSV